MSSNGCRSSAAPPLLLLLLLLGLGLVLVRGAGQEVVATSGTVNQTAPRFQWQEPLVHHSKKGINEDSPLHVRGQCGTATNFIGVALRYVYPRITHLNKHFYPWLLAQHGDLDISERNVIMVRHPLGWIRSIQRMPYFVQCAAPTPGAPCNMTLTITVGRSKKRVVEHFDSVADVFNRYYRSYLEWPGEWTLVRYEDLLLDLARTMVLMDPFGRLRVTGRPLTLPKNLRRPAKTHGDSRGFGSAHEYNLEQKYLQDWDVTRNGRVEEYCERLDDALLNRLGYSCP